jgi:hypothetical protein
MKVVFFNKKHFLASLVLIFMILLLIDIKINLIEENSFEVSTEPTLRIEALRSLIDELNSNPVKIKNKHILKHFYFENDYHKINHTAYQASLGENFKPITFLVILIQVHTRIGYLKELIGSMRRTKYIEDSLVIFSHDVYSPEMNKLINEIDFCAVSSLTSYKIRV